MMKAQVDGPKAPPSSSACTALPLAQEWRFSASCYAHKALLVPLACRDPRVSSAPEEETNKKAPLSHTEGALWHVCLFFTTGLRSSLRRGMTERTDFRNRASGKQNYCCFKLCFFFFSLNAIFTLCLLVVGFPPSTVLLRLQGLCPVLMYQHVSSKTQENYHQQQATNTLYLHCSYLL